MKQSLKTFHFLKTIHRRLLHLGFLFWVACSFAGVDSLFAAEKKLASAKQFAVDNDASLKSYQRIVSLDLCMDWMLVYYADPDKVTALSPFHQRYPLPINTENWPVHDGSLEHIFRLDPDVVLVGEFNALMLRSRLQRLNVPVYIIPLPRSLTEVVQYESTLMKLLNIQTPPIPTRVMMSEPDLAAPRLLLLGANGIGTGQKTFEDQLLIQAGWQNYLTEQGYLSLDLEQLVTDPPDAILWAAPESTALANQFAQHPVLSKQVPANAWLSTDVWRWQCPGPWTWDLIDQLAELREAFE